MGKPLKWKRGKPKNARAGCLMCKNWKVNGVPTESKEGESWNVHKQRVFARQAITTYWNGLD